VGWGVGGVETWVGRMGGVEVGGGGNVWGGEEEECRMGGA